MNLYKIYASVAILLALCTYESEAGLILLLLIKIIMLKGAIFFGLPLALGSFLLGQGAGFFKGSLFGGYTALHAAYKYQQKHAAKYKPHIVITHTPAHHHHGWGWTQSPGWGWEGSAPVTHHVPQPSKGWGWTPRPSFLKKLTTIPSYWANKIRDIKRNTQQGWGWQAADYHPETSHVVYEDEKEHHHAEPETGGYHASSGNNGYSGSSDGASSGYQDHGASSGYQDHGGTPDFNDEKTFTTLMKAVELAQQQYSADNPGSHDDQGGAKQATWTDYNPHSSDSHHSNFQSPDSLANIANVENYAYESQKDSVSVPPPNPLLENFLERKLREEIQNQKSESRRQEASQLIQMLREVYVQELVQSLVPNKDRANRRSDPTTPLPDFVPFPITDRIPNSTTAKPIVQQVNFNDNDSLTTTPAPPASTTIFSVYSAPTPPVVIAQPMFEGPKKRGRRRRPLRPLRANPNQISKRLGEIVGAGSRNRRQSAPQLPPVDLQALSGFTEDVKKFFLLVSLLDSDKCLQKLVCEVHTKPPTAQLTPYESNIVVTFKVMSVLMPSNVEDATTNYRKAAKIGELSKNVDICGKAYPTCTYSTDEIIRMGNQVAATEAPNGAQAGVTPSAVQSGDDQAADGSEVHGHTVPFREVTTAQVVTAEAAPSMMPQV